MDTNIMLALGLQQILTEDEEFLNKLEQQEHALHVVNAQLNSVAEKQERQALLPFDE